MKQTWILLTISAALCALLIGILWSLSGSDALRPGAEEDGLPPADVSPAVKSAPHAEPTEEQAAALAPPAIRQSTESADGITKRSPEVGESAAAPSVGNLSLPEAEVGIVRNKLKQIALAFLNYESANREFPPGRSKPKRHGLSWRVHVLPYVEQAPLYKRFHLEEPWDSPHNKALIDFMPDLYRTGAEEGSNTAFVIFRGPQTPFPPEGGVRHAQLSDGASNTLMVVHAGGGARVPWTKPDDVPFNADAPLEGIGFVNGRLEGALFDAHLISLPHSVLPQTLPGLITPHGNELVDGHGLARRYSPQTTAAAGASAAPEVAAARMHGDRNSAMGRMKQSALAMLNAESARGYYLGSMNWRRRDDPVELAMSWRVAVLPYIEQQNLFGRYKFDEPWNGPSNSALVGFMPGIYRHETGMDAAATRLQVLVGPGTPFGPHPRPHQSESSPGLRAQHLFDGASNTILAIESGGDRAVTWMAPRDLEFDPARPVESLGELEATGTFAAMFDGSVRPIDPGIDPQVLANLAMYRDEYEAANPSKAIDWASAVPITQLQAEAAAQAAASRAQAEARARRQQAAEPAIASAESAAPTDDTPDERITEFPTPRPAFDFAYDQPTGNVLAIEYENNQATLLKLDNGLAELAVAPCPARPTAVVAKRYKDKSYFAVGGRLDKRIDVFNAADGSRAASIYIQTPGIYEFAVSDRNDDPYVYYCSSRGEQSDYYVGRIDLARMKDEGELASAGGATVSADGSMIYLRGELNQSSSISAARIVEGGRKDGQDADRLMCPASLENVESSPPVTSALVTAGPGNAFLAIGNHLTSATASESLGQFDFSPLAFFADKPWAVGVQDRRLYVGSVNDKRTVAALNLPTSFAPDSVIQARAEDPVRNLFTRVSRVNPVFVDQPRGRIIICSEASLATVSIPSLELPDEPLVATSCTTHATAVADQELSIPIRAFDNRVQVRLVAGPPEAKLVDGAVRWTPTSRDIGATELLIESRRDPVKFEQRLHVAVVRPTVDTPLSPRHVALSPDGKLAVVWGPEHGVQLYSGTEVVERRLALIDVATGEVKATCEIAKGIWQARVDGGGVYVLTKPGSTEGQNVFAEVMRLNLDDLKLAASGGSVTVEGEPLFQPAPGRVLLAGQQRFRLPGLERVESKLLIDANYANSSRTPKAALTSEGWQFRGAIWNEAIDRANMLFSSPLFLGYRSLGNDDLTFVGWGRWQQDLTIFATPGKHLFATQDQNMAAMTVSPTLPVALVLAREVSAENVPRMVIQVHDLASGSRTQSLVLAPTESRDSYGWHAGFANALATAGNTIAACAEDSLYFLSTEEIDRTAVKPPFRVRMRQSELALSDDQSIQVEYALVDGEPPYEVTLTIDGFQSQITTDNVADFRLNGAKIRENALGTIRNLNWPPIKDQKPDSRTRVVDYINAVSPVFKELTGRSPKGLPVLVHVTLQATDKSLASTSFNHCYFIELPQARAARALSNTEQNFRREPFALQSPFAPEPQRTAAQRAAEAKRKEQLAELDAELATIYSDELRKEHPSQQVDDAVLARQARKGAQAANAMLTAVLTSDAAASAQQPRTWSDKNGHSTVATLHSVFADQVILMQANGAQITAPIEKLSPADQRFIADSGQLDAISPSKFAVAQMQMIMQAIDRHVRRTGGYPPAYICDAKGKPLLSWRVAILPDLGATDLFNLFHFDEPWNGPHNKKLGSYMPLVFQPAQSTPRKFSTSILGFRDEGSLLADSRSLSPRDVKDATSSIIVLGEVKTNRLVPWSQPVDIAPSDIDRLDALLSPHGDYFIVGVADGSAKALPRQTAVEAWKAAVGRADGQLPPAPLMPPRAVPLGDAEKDVSLRQLEGDLAPTDAEHVRASNARGRPLAVQNGVPTTSLPKGAKVGTPVARATGAPRGYQYKLVDSTGAFAINPLTGVITVERLDRINLQLYPSHLLKVVAVNVEGREVPASVVQANEQ